LRSLIPITLQNLPFDYPEMSWEISLNLSLIFDNDMYVYAVMISVFFKNYTIPYFAVGPDYI